MTSKFLQTQINALTERYKPENWKGFPHQNDVIAKFGQTIVACTVVLAYGLGDVASAIREADSAQPLRPHKPKGPTSEELELQRKLEELKAQREREAAENEAGEPAGS
jgi:hypothetical protein